MRVEITKRFYFDDNEREKFWTWCVKKHIGINVLASEFKVSKQYVYSLLNGTLAITPKFAKKFYDLGYDLGEEINGTKRTRIENYNLCD